ncbi:SGNH hydrolase [Mycena leptocephala]|nr:SGNH hydrolase [Mycena leptocephala]
MLAITPLLTALIIAGAAGALAQRADAASTAFVLAGDSTTYLNGGWGPGFCADLAAGVPCVITAFSGETTGSFFADGRWNQTLDALRTNLQAGRRTFVTMQFGHNDQKIAPPETMGANLAIMVDQIRATERQVGSTVAKAEPILVTSLTRRNWFSNGTFDDILQPWADVTLLTAKQKTTASFDLHKSSMDYVEAIGPTAAHVLNLSPSDNTHLNDNGALVFGRMMADFFVAKYGPCVPIIPNAALSFNISHGIPSF